MSDEETVQHVNVKQLCLSDHYAVVVFCLFVCLFFVVVVFCFVFCNRKCKSVVGSNTHQVINYRSFKKFDESTFLDDLSLVPWEIIQNFDAVDDIVSTWNTLFLEIHVLDKHDPVKSHRIKKKYQPDLLTPEILDCKKERNKYKIHGSL